MQQHALFHVLLILPFFNVPVTPIGPPASSSCPELVSLQARARAEIFAYARVLHERLLVDKQQPQQLADTFYNAFTFTANHTLEVFELDCTTFVTTGDIPQMWLRDSSVQLGTYAQHAPMLPAFTAVLESVMLRQMRFFLGAPYDSAFFKETGPGSDEGPSKAECAPSAACPDCTCVDCSPACSAYTYQHDFELDSPLFMFQLQVKYWRASPARAAAFLRAHRVEVARAVRALCDLMTAEQHHFRDSPYFYKELPGPFREGIGLVWSFARPSDDQTVLGYNIPQNLMAIAVIAELREMHLALQGEQGGAGGAGEQGEHGESPAGGAGAGGAGAAGGRGGGGGGGIIDGALQADLARLQASIERGVSQYGVVYVDAFADSAYFIDSAEEVEALAEVAEEGGKEEEDAAYPIFAYEVDGWGNQSAPLLDDANMPNLLWLPHLRLPASALARLPDGIVHNTRRAVLSRRNENWFVNRTTSSSFPSTGSSSSSSSSSSTATATSSDSVVAPAPTAASSTSSSASSSSSAPSSASSSSVPSSATGAVAIAGGLPAGLGSQHISGGLRPVWPGPECEERCIWHLGLIVQGMTAGATPTHNTPDAKSTAGEQEQEQEEEEDGDGDDGGIPSTSRAPSSSSLWSSRQRAEHGAEASAASPLWPSSPGGEKAECMAQVLATAWHGLMHEGFNVANTSHYNRDYFGWANALFAEWVIADYL